LVQIGDDDGSGQRRNFRLQAGDRVAAVEILAAIAIAVHAEEHLRLDLGEAVDDAAGAEVR
jgi:hypothetical protein